MGVDWAAAERWEIDRDRAIDRAEEIVDGTGGTVFDTASVMAILDVEFMGSEFYPSGCPAFMDRVDCLVRDAVTG